MDGPLACDRIADVIEAVTDGARQPISLGERLRRTLARAAPRRRATGNGGGEQSHKRRRFPDTPLAAVEHRIARLRRSLDRFHEVSVRQLAPNVFQVMGP
jgi:hypothetical protein